MQYDNLVFVTGASRGLGLALAEQVPWEKTRVVGFGRSKPPPFAARRADVALEWVWVNLGSADGADVVASTIDRELKGFWGERILFFNNAGTLAPIGPVDKVDSRDYKQALMLGTVTPLAIAQHFLKAVKETSKDTWLVNISSGAASSAYPGWSAYCAGKAALDHWTRCASLELAKRPHATRVYAVAPGVLDTAMQVQIRATPKADFPPVDKFIDLHKEGRLTPPEDAAKRLYRFLLLPRGRPPVVDLRDYGDL